jgi:hypothetical protein
VPRRPAPVVLALTVLATLAGCGGGVVRAENVARSVADQVEAQAGSRPVVTCPDDLEAAVGATARCRLTLGGLDGAYGVTVTVTGVRDHQASFDVEVDQQPLR